jgi:hypothetical protein
MFEKLVKMLLCIIYECSHSNSRKHPPMILLCVILGLSAQGFGFTRTSIKGWKFLMGKITLGKPSGVDFPL